VTDSLPLHLPAEAIESIAQRAAEILASRDRIDDPSDRWVRGAAGIADYIDAPRSRVYALASCQPPRIPVERDGSTLVARRSELDAWIRAGGGLRP
jgi:hypothetical protein